MNEPMTEEQIRNWEIAKQALRESPDPEGFGMERYAHACGTPMCVLGHYAAREDLQQHMVLGMHPDPLGGLSFLAPLWRDTRERACGVHSDDEERLYELFGFTGSTGREGSGGEDFETSPTEEADMLFDSDGCGEAESIEDAIGFIDRFVASKKA